MRIVRRDFARYNALQGDDLDEDSEYGWKIIHTDVFRLPKHANLFAAILGMSGTLSMTRLYSICYEKW